MTRVPRLTAARSPVGSILPWIVLAVLCGALIALLPLSISLVALAGIVLIILSLIEPRVALLGTLVIAPLKTLIETESHLTLPLDVGQIAFLATTAIWLARSIADRRRLDLPWTPIYLPILLFTFAASLSLWVSLSPGGTLNELLKWAAMLVLIALVVSMSRDHGTDQGLHWIATALILSAVVQAVIGIYEFFGGSGAASLWILDFRYFRAFGSFGQPNPFGAFMGLTLPVALGAAFGATMEAWRTLALIPGPSPLWRRVKRRGFAPLPEGEGRQGEGHIQNRQSWRAAAIAAVYWIEAAVIGVGLLVSWSRGAWIGFLAAAVVMLFFVPRRRLIGLALVTLLVGGGAIFVFSGLAPASLVTRISDFAQDFTGFQDVRGTIISDQNFAVVERLAHWQAAVAITNDAPWLGVGFGNYEIAYPRYALMNWANPLGHAHNYYLNLLAETGIVGLSAYLVAWLIIVALTLRVLNRQTGFYCGLALGLLGAWTHLAVHSLFDKLYVNNLFLHIGVMLGLMGGLLLLGKTSHETQETT